MELLDPNLPVNQCAGTVPGETIEICSPPEVIDKIGSAIGVIGSPEKVLDAAKKKIGCDSESCVLESELAKKAIGPEAEIILKQNFKPVGPAKSTDLLSNFNIDDYLEQLHHKYPTFYHIPFQMIDFEKTGSTLAKINAAELRAHGVRSFGCVVNTDNSRGGGIHWFAIYGDLVNNTLEFFNSSGNSPMDEVAIWMNKFCRESGMREVIVSKMRHQKGDTECGMYSLYYIVNRLSGKPFKSFQKYIIPDDMMILMREHMFRPEKKNGQIDRTGLGPKIETKPIPV